MLTLVIVGAHEVPGEGGEGLGIVEAPWRGLTGLADVYRARTAHPSIKSPLAAIQLPATRTTIRAH